MIEHDEIKIKIGGLNFTWDDRKAEINKKKHNISFSTAAYVFLDTKGNNIFRIISARRAEREERNNYVYGIR